MEVQRQIDFGRAEQRGLLRKAEIPATGGAAGMALKSVLRVIDDHGRGRRCWLKHETIAQEAGCSIRTAERATAALAELGLLCVERRRIAGAGCATCNHYTIVWGELAILCRSGKMDQPAISSDQPAISSLPNRHLVATKPPWMAVTGEGTQEAPNEGDEEEDQTDIHVGLAPSSPSSQINMREVFEVCGKAWRIMKPRTPPPQTPYDPDHELVRTLGVLAVRYYGRQWLLGSCHTAARKRPGSLDYLKGVAANASNDRKLFFERFDFEIHKFRQKREASHARE